MGKVLTTSKVSAVSGRSPLSYKFSASAIAVALASVFSAVSVPADAAGLGRLTVQSALGQPLRAEVEVTSLTDDEASSLAAKLARPEAFRDAGLEFNPALTGLRFNVQRKGSGAIVSIRSTRPVNEPFVDLLVELTWSSGKFVREYTFLLDPPELRVGQPQPIEGGPSSTSVVTPRQAPNSAISPAAARTPAADRIDGVTAQTVAAGRIDAATAQTAAAVVAARLATAAAENNVAAATTVNGTAGLARGAAPAGIAPTAAPLATNPSNPGTRQVVAGDTLANIARELQPDAVSLNQAMVAIYRKNTGAFFGSVHQLRAGTILQMPNADELAAVTASDATQEIRASNETWRTYRERLAQAASDSVGATMATAESNAAVGSISAAADDTGAPTGEADELRLTRDASGQVGASATAAGQSDANASAEESDIARDAALRNAQGRVSELERNVADLQRLLELKNKQLADLGNQVAQLETDNLVRPSDGLSGSIGLTPSGESTETAAATPLAADDPSTMTPLSDSGTMAESVTGAVTGAIDGTASGADSVAETMTGAIDSVTQAGSDAASDAAGAIPSVATDASDASDASAAAAAAARAAAIEPAATPAASLQPVAVAPEPAPTESLVDTVMNTVTSNPLVPIGAAALIGIGGFFAWRRRKSKGSEDRFEDTLGGDDAFAANSLFGTTGGQDVDTSNSLFNTGVVSDTSVDVHTTEVDPIAEAEVYIAYGREAQAEEILKEALKRQPDRQAIRLKLLEIYAGRKDAGAYGAVARDMYDSTGGQNEEWPKVITMGLSIDPENPLYTGNGEVAGDAPEASDTAGRDGPSASGMASAAGVAATGAAATAGLVDALSANTRDEPSSDAVTARADSIDLGAQTLTAADSETITSVDTAQAAVQARDDDIEGLDFDLDINTEVDTSIDMMAGINTEELGAETLSAALEANVEMPTLELDDHDLSLDTAAITGMDELNVEIPSLDTITGHTGSVATDVDLASIGLDLSSNPDVAVAGDGAKWQEMATKLDLASAYEEIGDKEGARELLDEVVKDGDNSQQQKARAMLSKIS